MLFLLILSPLSLSLSLCLFDTHLRTINSLFSILYQMIRNILTYNRQSHPDFPILSDQIKAYVPRYLIFCLIWCFSGDGKMSYREKMEDFICSTTAIPVPPGTTPIIDFEVDTQGEWVLWSNRLGDDVFTIFCYKITYVCSFSFTPTSFSLIHILYCTRQ